MIDRESLIKALEESKLKPRARWRLFGVTKRDIDAARSRLIKVLKDTR